VDGRRQAAGKLATLTSRFTLGTWLLGAMLTSSLVVGPTVTAAAQSIPVNKVRDVGVSWVAGPVQLVPGGSALARLWLPAVQRGVVRLTYLGDGGQVLGQSDVAMPPQPGGFFEVVVDATYDGKTLSITDGTSNTIAFGESQGIIAILIGILSPKDQHSGIARPMATLQLSSGPGQPFLLLPFIEQEN
jgi:hypothetical protein